MNDTIAKYTAPQVAKILGVSLSTVYALKKAKLLVPLKVGVKKGYRWTDQIIADFLAKGGDVSAKKVSQKPIGPLQHLDLSPRHLSRRA